MYDRCAGKIEPYLHVITTTQERYAFGRVKSSVPCYNCKTPPPIGCYMGVSCYVSSDNVFFLEFFCIECMRKTVALELALRNDKERLLKDLGLKEQARWMRVFALEESIDHCMTNSTNHAVWHLTYELRDP